MLKNLSKNKQRLVFFLAGGIEDFYFIAWLNAIAKKQIVVVVVLAFVWCYIRSLYFLIPPELARTMIFYEALGVALGAGLSLYILK